jgi:hypothetical protein
VRETGKDQGREGGRGRENKRVRKLREREGGAERVRVVTELD